MDFLAKIFFIGLVSGMVGTGIGGLTAFFFAKINNRLLGFILELSAGLMTSVVCFELLPDSFKAGGLFYTILGVVLGIGMIIFIDNFLRRISKKNKRESILLSKINSGKKSLLKVGILTGIGIAFHNFPEGFAVGAGFKASTSLGITMTSIIAIHDIPEGMAMAVPLKMGGFSSRKAFLLTLLSGLPMGVGAVFGAALGGISSHVLAVCLGLAAGTMLYVVYGELITESKKLYLGRLPSIGNIIGIILGMIITM